MKRVYTTESVAMAWHIRNVLEQSNIETVVKNDKLFSIAGEVPITECMAEVWVTRNLDFQRAENIIRELENATEPEGVDWLCKACGEENGASFAICWSCQHSDD